MTDIAAPEIAKVIVSAQITEATRDELQRLAAEAEHNLSEEIRIAIFEYLASKVSS